MIPRWKQFNKWSLPSKYTFIGFWLSILLFLIPYIFSSEESSFSKDITVNNEDILRKFKNLNETIENYHLTWEEKENIIIERIKSIDAKFKNKITDIPSSLSPTVKLRYGYTYYFLNRFNNSSSEYVFVNSAIGSRLVEKENYNENTEKFGFVQKFIEKNYEIRPHSSEKIYASDGYTIRKKPQKRLYDNIVITYITTYQYWQEKLKTRTNRKKFISIQPYTITWCGDGIIDNYIDPATKDNIIELCDPKDIHKTNWGKDGCSDSCRPKV